ncbi:hypothetical protein GobsT_26390 [Gemmata obscuriglobus]|nr:hypothetical protein GobsT_26390 [Gemmata obscuriglobus]VTS05276.1 unnamed protein product [Gemmata obscuriglobus UQM 2246]
MLVPQDQLQATMRTAQNTVSNFLAGVQWGAIEGEGAGCRRHSGC